MAKNGKEWQRMAKNGKEWQTLRKTHRRQEIRDANRERENMQLGKIEREINRASLEDLQNLLFSYVQEEYLSLDTADQNELYNYLINYFKGDE